MKSQSGLDSFWPYDSIDEIYADKIMPEFGLVPSKWQFYVPSWRFFHAENRDMVPLDFMEPTCNDSLWDAIELPSVWQQEGYGLPSNLMYDAGTKEVGSRLRKRVKAKFAALGSSEADDDVGVYRTWIVLPDNFLKRAVYFSCSGIRGRFELFVNGNLVTTSSACYSTQKILLSPFLQMENNLLTLLIYRLDSDHHGRVRRENGTFGYSGIFRLPEIIAEPFVDIAEIHLRTTWVDRQEQPGPADLAGVGTGTDLLDDVSGRADLLLPDPGSRRDANLRVQVTLLNHTDLLIPVFVKCEIIESRNEYDLYHLPVHPAAADKEMTGSISSGALLTLHSQINAAGILPWSDQTPNLYDLVLTVKDAHDRVICVKKRRFGFRTTEVHARVFHINDIALPLRAVRYFDFDPVTGLAVSVERMRQDICLIKQANLNAVITAHFPSDPMFYRMCDHYGLYVISQADPIHIHAMFESLMTHPSIVFWSFAPLHFDESKLWEAKQKLLLLDSTRPFYCENDRSLTLSDIPPFPCEAGSLFGEWADIGVDRRILQSKLEPGQSIFESQAGRAKRDSDAADYRWIHQGDLEEFHEKMDVPVAQGIVSPDRSVHPIYYEIKKQCETLQFLASSDNSSELCVYNLHPIGKTGNLVVHWQLLLGGFRIKGGSGLVKSIDPLGRQEMRFPFDVSDYTTQNWMQADPLLCHIYDVSLSHELVLDIRACLAEDAAYVNKGHEIAFYQQVLIDETAGRSQSSGLSQSNLPAARADSALFSVRPEETSMKLKISTIPEALTVSHSAMQIDISRKSGGLQSILVGDQELLAGSLQPSFYRAATNSDRSDQSFVLAATVFSKETDWRTIQSDLRYQRFHYEMAGEDFIMLVHYKSFAFKGEVLMQYIMGSDGKLTVTMAFTPRYDLLRSGFRVRISQLMNHLGWYGRGLHEAYPDRKESARIGFYEATPRMLYHEYVRPQENGGHCDTKYLLISDGNGKGIKITTGEKERFSFQASLFSPEDIDDHQHQEELSGKDTYELFLDFYQRDIERTGQETRRFIKNQTYRGTFIFEPWEAVQQEPSSHESP